jgi:ribosomal protein L34E
VEILLVLVVGWLVITAAIGVVVRYGVERRARRPRHARRPGCANCGYPVQGLPRPRCPECGADLRATGVYYDIGV